MRKSGKDTHENESQQPSEVENLSKDAGEATEGETPRFEMRPTRTFLPWLANTGSSIAFTTYQAGKIFMVGTNRETGRLSVFERSFPRSMGFGVDPSGNTLWLSTLFQLWRFENFLEPGQNQDGYDAVYVPLDGRTTGDVDIHDVCPSPSRSAPPTFVVTRFNCLATLDHRNSFKPVWKPPFIDRIAAEDRCHLNGMAIRGEKPAFVTCVSTTNVAGGWRDHRADGGVVLDVESGAEVATGLSMPHAPRWHDGQLYILQAGTGEFGRIDMKSGAFEPICFLPGFARGVAFTGTHAVIGVSRPRHGDMFEGLAIKDRLEADKIGPRTMIAVVNLETGDIEHSLDIEGNAVRELYDVAILPGVRRPMLIGFKSDDVRFMIRPTPGAMAET